MGIILSLNLFKLFGDREDYYKGNFVSLNRSMITFKLFEKQHKQSNYNSFIFGNSRSQAYKCDNWLQYLPESASPFHFDGSGEGIYGTSKKITYLDKNNVNIDHALLVIDRAFLKNISNKEEHITIANTELTNESNYTYYKTFLYANFNPDFLAAYFDYKINGQYRPYMQDLIRNLKYSDSCNYQTGDLYYGYDNWIKTDSIGYYQHMLKKGAFIRREKKEKRCMITTQEVLQLRTIREIFEKHQTTYKIVISPIYDQIPMEADQVALLSAIFGKNNIFDYSGKNIHTSTLSNYYETSHYRPVLANKIMRAIYPK